MKCENCFLTGLPASTSAFISSSCPQSSVTQACWSAHAPSPPLVLSSVPPPFFFWLSSILSSLALTSGWAFSPCPFHWLPEIHDKNSRWLLQRVCIAFTSVIISFKNNLQNRIKKVTWCSPQYPLSPFSITDLQCSAGYKVTQNKNFCLFYCLEFGVAIWLSSG